MRKLCTYDEYTDALGSSFLFGILTGLADATITDWTTKAFVWAGFLLLYAIVVSYKFIIMPTPPRPLLQATVFAAVAPMGLLSAHHFTWLIVSVMLGYRIERRLWLAPNIYTDLYTYTLATVLMFLIYFVIIFFASSRKCNEN